VPQFTRQTELGPVTFTGREGLTRGELDEMVADWVATMRQAEEAPAPEPARAPAPPPMTLAGASDAPRGPELIEQLPEEPPKQAYVPGIRADTGRSGVTVFGPADAPTAELAEAATGRLPQAPVFDVQDPAFIEQVVAPTVEGVPGVLIGAAKEAVAGFTDEESRAKERQEEARRKLVQRMFSDSETNVLVEAIGDDFDELLAIFGSDGGPTKEETEIEGSFGFEVPEGATTDDIRAIIQSKKAGREAGREMTASFKAALDITDPEAAMYFWLADPVEAGLEASWIFPGLDPFSMAVQGIKAGGKAGATGYRLMKNIRAARAAKKTMMVEQAGEMQAKALSGLDLAKAEAAELKARIAKEIEGEIPRPEEPDLPQGVSQKVLEAEDAARIAARERDVADQALDAVAEEADATVLGAQDLKRQQTRFIQGEAKRPVDEFVPEGVVAPEQPVGMPTEVAQAEQAALDAERAAAMADVQATRAQEGAATTKAETDAYIKNVRQEQAAVRREPLGDVPPPESPGIIESLADPAKARNAELDGLAYDIAKNKPVRSAAPEITAREAQAIEWTMANASQEAMRAFVQDLLDAGMTGRKLGPMSQGERITWEQTAQAVIDQGFAVLDPKTKMLVMNQDAMFGLMDGVIDNGLTPSATEQLAMGRYKVEIANRIERVVREQQAMGNPANADAVQLATENAAVMDASTATHQRLEKALKVTGSRASALMRQRQYFLAKGATLADFLARKKATQGGHPLNAEQQAKVTKQYDNIEAKVAESEKVLSEAESNLKKLMDSKTSKARKKVKEAKPKKKTEEQVEIDTARESVIKAKAEKKAIEKELREAKAAEKKETARLERVRKQEERILQREQKAAELKALDDEARAASRAAKAEADVAKEALKDLREAERVAGGADRELKKLLKKADRDFIKADEKAQKAAERAAGTEVKKAYLAELRGQRAAYDEAIAEAKAAKQEAASRFREADRRSKDADRELNAEIAKSERAMARAENKLKRRTDREIKQVAEALAKRDPRVKKAVRDVLDARRKATTAGRLKQHIYGEMGGTAMGQLLTRLWRGVEYSTPMTTMGDLSFLGRQFSGGLMWATALEFTGLLPGQTMRGIPGSTALRTSYESLKALVSPVAAREAAQALRDTPAAAIADEAGLVWKTVEDISAPGKQQTEEMFRSLERMGAWAQKGPMAALLRNSDNSISLGGDIIRRSLFDHYAKVPGITMDELKEIAHLINTMTGTTSIRRGLANRPGGMLPSNAYETLAKTQQAALDIGAKLTISPRLYLSQLKTPFLMARGITSGNKNIQSAAAMAAMSDVMIRMSMYGTLGYMGARYYDNLDHDTAMARGMAAMIPGSPYYGKLVYGGQQVGLDGGTAALWRYALPAPTLANGDEWFSPERVAAWWKDKTLSLPEGRINLMGDRYLEKAVRGLKYKAHPALGSMYDIMAGETFYGKGKDPEDYQTGWEYAFDRYAAPVLGSYIAFPAQTTAKRMAGQMVDDPSETVFLNEGDRYLIDTPAWLMPMEVLMDFGGITGGKSRYAIEDERAAKRRSGKVKMPSMPKLPSMPRLP
jgi:hypothetical protein